MGAASCSPASPANLGGCKQGKSLLQRLHLAVLLLHAMPTLLKHPHCSGEECSSSFLQRQQQEQQ
eukprot:CAMPEP_0172763610 /NCGR_PEP_ID=MMETSP1074-20121228/175660_1 /TAXON_ID=2916 /ORGANISM="Ceratium fusus, Strain PA161109" /LENGTH=64 /DNA_ID=CAMNT_0013598227 /DNA_START=136 /DNA_END=327 /DNA_ORIENTATION=-